MVSTYDLYGSYTWFATLIFQKIRNYTHNLFLNDHLMHDMYNPVDSRYMVSQSFKYSTHRFDCIIIIILFIRLFFKYILLRFTKVKNQCLLIIRISYKLTCIKKRIPTYNAGHIIYINT